MPKKKRLEDYFGGSYYKSLKELIPRIYHIQYPTRFALNSTFMRFSEYQESSMFKDLRFSHEELMSQFVHEYEADVFDSVDGFNIPSETFDAFKSGLFDPLWRREQDLLDIISNFEKPFICGWTKDQSLGSASFSVIVSLYTSYQSITLPSYDGKELSVTIL